MNNVFSERSAIEIAFKGLELEKEQRRAELREDLNKIDDRQYYILERLRELPEIATRPIPVLPIQVAADPIQADPGTTQAAPKELIETVNLREKEIQAAPLATGTKPKPTPRTTPKKTPVANGFMTHEQGAEKFLEIIKEAGGPIKPKQIEQKMFEKTGKRYANIYEQIRVWMKYTGDKVQKIGAEYSIK